MPDIPKLVVLQLLRAYKWAVSPLFPPACCYVPTCSEYAVEAVDRYGVLRGGLMSVARLLRCHPFARGGYDPVVKRIEGPSVCGCEKTLAASSIARTSVDETKAVGATAARATVEKRRFSAA